MSARFTLANAALKLELEPRVGGAITAFRRRNADGTFTQIFRDAPAVLRDVVDASAFPLVPFSNRIRGGCFTFRGREVRLAPNMKGDPNALHGQGWRGAWSVEQADASSVELRFDHPPGKWPWAYEARQRFQLRADGLDYALSVRNLSREPMPAGLGLHPYFPCDAATVLDASVTTVWTVDKRVLPIAQEPAVGRYDLRDRKIDRAGLDNGFGGWSGEASVSWPNETMRLHMTSPGTRYFQVYAPSAGGVFAAEPVTHANAALNHSEAEWDALGLKVLEPDEDMRLDVRFDLDPATLR